jgi:hypothetical protein
MVQQDTPNQHISIRYFETLKKSNQTYSKDTLQVPLSSTGLAVFGLTLTYPTLLLLPWEGTLYLVLSNFEKQILCLLLRESYLRVILPSLYFYHCAV